VLLAELLPGAGQHLQKQPAAATAALEARLAHRRQPDVRTTLS
jgi:hypothetical protein